MKYSCTLCDYVYDPTVGDPDGDIAPGTEFKDIPEDWVCPLCGATKDDFEPVKWFKTNKKCDVYLGIAFFY